MRTDDPTPPEYDELLVVRSALLPRILGADGLVSPQMIVTPLHGHQFEDGTKGLVLSVGSGKMLDSDAKAHDFGCRVAASTNLLFEHKNGYSPQGDKRVHYRGAYDLGVKEVLAIDPPDFDISISRCPENGLHEHCHIEFRPKADVSNSRVQKNRTVLIAQLFLCLRNPREHICACDDEFREELELYSLPDIQAA